MGSDRRTYRAIILEEWLASHASLDIADARYIAEQLSNRSEPKVKRSALSNILRVRLDKTEAKRCARRLIDSGVLRPEEQSGGNTLRIDYTTLDAKREICRKDSVANDAESISGIFSSRLMRLRSTTIAASPGKLARFRHQLGMLDAWLCEAERNTCERATRGQRAYEIFNDEKMLDEHHNMAFATFLKQVGITVEDLHVEALSEMPAEIFIPHGARSPLVVVENRDTFQTLRFLLAQDVNLNVFGDRIGGVVYGAGGAVGTDHLLDKTLEQVGYRLPYVLYCGDIDRSGVCIVSQAREANDIEIRLARGMYKAMVRKQKARTRHGWEMECAARQAFPEHLDEIAKEIPLFARWQFLCAVRENKRIPQEILSLEDYLDCMR